MVLKDLVALMGRVALVMLVFAFIAGIIAGPLLQKVGLRPSVTAAQDPAMPGLIRVKSTPVPGVQG